MFGTRCRRALAGIVPAMALILGTMATALAQDVDWSGTWDSRWRDGGAILYMTQEGELVTGAYPALEGTIRGELRGQLLVGVWTDPGGTGEFTFALARDGQSFSGRFGTGEWWTGERILFDRAADGVAADASTPEAALVSFVRAGNRAVENRIDRFGPALRVLDFGEVPAEAIGRPFDRLRLAARFFAVVDQLTFRVWHTAVPRPGERDVSTVFGQAGTGETFEMRFRYGVRPNGAAGWFIVVPPPDEIEAALARLLAHRGGELPHARAHHALASPRDAMRTFLEQYRVWEETGDGALLFRTLDTGAGRGAPSEETALRAQYLKEVIGRVGDTLWQEIPNDPAQEGVYTHFIHPEGRIEIGATETEEGGRIWRFTPETMAAARALYIALEDMPLAAGVEAETSSFFLNLRNAIRGFDRDLLGTVGGVEIWQWLALGAFLVAGGLLSWLIAWAVFRVLLRMKREPGELLGVRWRFMVPLQLVIVAGLGLLALRLLGLPETVDLPLRIVAGVLLSLGGGWFLYNLVDKIGSLVGEASGRLRYRDEMLRSLVVAVVKVAVVIGAFLFLAEVLSIPYQGVIAGLGIGGLAVALAARSTIENFIGGLTLIADKPIQVGDFCKFGDQVGTIEGIGLRSVKVRSLDRTLVTVPNGEFVNLYLENFSRRDRILMKTVLQLRYETTPDQMRWVLAELRRMMLQHPKVLADPSRARFVGFGAHSLDIEVFAYVSSTDWNEYLGIQEDIYLRMIDIVEQSGSGFAFPSTVNYLARDPGVDEEARARAEAEVARLRDEDRLPFPEFDAEERFAIFNRLEFPGDGSPHGRRARERREAEADERAGS